jgi:hypothetical protein
VYQFDYADDPERILNKPDARIHRSLAGQLDADH